MRTAGMSRSISAVTRLRPRRCWSEEKESARLVAGFQARISPSRMAGSLVGAKGLAGVVSIGGVEGCGGGLDVDWGSDAVKFVFYWAARRGGAGAKALF